MKKIYLLLLLFIAACNSTKHVLEDEHLLVKNSIYVDRVKYRKTDLDKYVLQKPNPKFLGLPFGLYIHNLGKKEASSSPKEWGLENIHTYNFIKSIFSEKQSIAFANYWIHLNQWFLNYEKPEIINTFKVNSTRANLEAYYKNQGYFNVQVTSSIAKNATKKAKVAYHISPGIVSTIDTISLNIKSPLLDSIFKKSRSTILLKKGSPYKDQIFRREAKKMVKLFRNNGIYRFNEAAIGFYIDATQKKNKINVDYIIDKGRVVEKENGSYKTELFKIYKLRHINIFTDYTFARKDEKYNDTITYKGIHFYAHDKLKYNPKYLSQAVFFKPNDIYKDTLRMLTRTHLKSLKNFKTTNISYQKVFQEGDLLDMNVYLTPTDKYTLGVETELTHSNIRDIGASLKFSRTDRNLFKGSELLKISLLGSYFIAVNGPGFEIGADASLEIPRFVAPFGLSKVVPKRMSPRTFYSLGSSFQKNIGLDRQTFTFLSDYQWKSDRKKTIQIELFNTQYIQNLNVRRYFEIYRSEFTTLQNINAIYPATNQPLSTDKNVQAADVLRFVGTVSRDTSFRNSNREDYDNVKNIFNRYKIITSNFLIPTLAYSFTYNTQTNVKDNSFSFFKMRLANAGNILGLLSKKKNSDDKTTFLEIPLAQYFKTDFEYKKFWEINANSVLAFRAFSGAIFTYDNSDIPFTRSYFAGGSNDIRAWQTYELGPGSSTSGLEFNVGSFKFLTSAEYRFGIFGSLKGAFFVDAGNIWDITGGEFVDEASKFTGFSSFKNIAVGTGMGARVDFDFLIIRLDLGFKTYEPYLNGKRWFQNFDLSNSVLNLGINYPF